MTIAFHSIFSWENRELGGKQGEMCVYRGREKIVDGVLETVIPLVLGLLTPSKLHITAI